MPCFWRTSDLAVLLIWGVFVVESSCMNQTSQNDSAPAEASTPVSVQMGAKVLLCCPPISGTKPVVLITWRITLRGQPPCIISYNVETKEIGEINCTDRRITWASTLDQSPDLQINTVVLRHEGHYSCQVASIEGHFQQRYDLQVLVPPEVTLFPGEKRTAVCEAIAGKPAAQISWSPDEYHVTKNESHSNGTVTVRSTYHGEHSNASAVSCFVSHPTGNQTLSAELNKGDDKALKLYIPYIVCSAIFVLIVVGCICLLKISGFRKCKWTRPETSPVVEEDEMQPYASYAEKNNPLYDTATNVEVCLASQGEVNGTNWLALSATEI